VVKSKELPKSIDEYIAVFPEDVRAILQKIRITIKSVIPDAEETIKYGIPTFMLNKVNLVHFGGYQKHIGFYPTPSGVEKFKKELYVYESAKGSVQFPLDRPMPYSLIGKIASFREKEVRKRGLDKKKSNSKSTR
jgi:uncharacterized protein YdhG (YjbR/CyaY superfamily)